MLEKLQRPPIGSDQKTNSERHSVDSEMQSKMTQRQQRAAKHVRTLFGLLPPQDVGDPETFLSGVIAVFAEHADEVQREAVIEIAKLSDRPTIKLISGVLAEIDDRRREHERTVADKLRLPPPYRKRTPEEQARADALVAETRLAFGLPAQGRGRINNEKTG